jgi:hypothetical protein
MRVPVYRRAFGHEIQAITSDNDDRAVPAERRRILPVDRDYVTASTPEPDGGARAGYCAGGGWQQQPCTLQAAHQMNTLLSKREKR